MIVDLSRKDVLQKLSCRLLVSFGKDHPSRILNDIESWSVFWISLVTFHDRIQRLESRGHPQLHRDNLGVMSVLIFGADGIELRLRTIQSVDLHEVFNVGELISHQSILCELTLSALTHLRSLLSKL